MKRTKNISGSHNWTKKKSNPNLENLKTSNVQDADEGGPLPFGSVQSFVNAMDQPAEQTLICGFSQGLNSKVSLQAERGEGRRMGRQYKETQLSQYNSDPQWTNGLIHLGNAVYC